MDYDGFNEMMERDREKFFEQDKKSKKMSLTQLRDAHNEWHEKLLEVYHKYADVKNEDPSTFMARTNYMFHIAIFGWTTLREYTRRLTEELDKKKKQTKTTTKKATAKKRSKARAKN